MFKNGISFSEVLLMLGAVILGVGMTLMLRAVKANLSNETKAPAEETTFKTEIVKIQSNSEFDTFRIIDHETGVVCYGNNKSLNCVKIKLSAPRN
jgi:hypothetical protein